ncbi:MAG: hypothetical protein AAGF59_11440 [Pseudomonadota bacterium]
MGSSELVEGARNLLVNCAGLSGGESLVLFEEDPGLGWYDQGASDAVADVARSMGMTVTRFSVDAPGRNSDRAEKIQNVLQSHDQAVYFARLGDEDRFGPTTTERAPVMSYVTSASALASPFGRFDHHAFLSLKDTVNAVFDAAGEIHVTCPLGTDLTGSIAELAPDGPEDVSVKRFPLCVYKPLSMKGFSGRIALSRHLVPTGSRPYDPAVARFGGIVFANVEQGTILGFEGSRDDVDIINSHYNLVADRFGIDPFVTHSWHSGLHPGCRFDGTADDDPDRWANTIFGNPRILHCHTCGDYAPGEICWMVIDAAIRVDGRALWEAGRMNIDYSEELSAEIGRWTGLADLLREPERAIGL